MEPEKPVENPVQTPPPPKKKKRLWFYLGFAIPVIGLLAAIAVPNFVRGRTTACKNACVNNLRQIDGAKESWALENKKSAGEPLTAADEKQINRYIKGEEGPKCPAGGNYIYGNVGEAPKCSLLIDGHSL
jgi:hypothetical protein